MTPNQLIKMIRLKCGISQSVFAKRVGISKRSLQKWEQNAMVPNSNDLFKCLNHIHPGILENIEKMLK